MRLWHAETSFFIIGTTNRDAMHKVLLTLTMLHVASIHAIANEDYSTRSSVQPTGLLVITAACKSTALASPPNPLTGYLGPSLIAVSPQ